MSIDIYTYLLFYVNTNDRHMYTKYVQTFKMFHRTVLQL